MTSADAEAVRELADAAGIDCDQEIEDSGVPLGRVFTGRSVVSVKATAACYFVSLNGHRFKDHVAAMVYVRVVTGRDKP